MYSTRGDAGNFKSSMLRYGESNKKMLLYDSVVPLYVIGATFFYGKYMEQNYTGKQGVCSKHMDGYVVKMCYVSSIFLGPTHTESQH